MDLKMSDAAFLYYLLPNSIMNTSLLDKYRLVLRPEEQREIDFLIFQRHQNEKLVARAMLRKALSDLTGLNPMAWQFRNTPYGRPEIERPGDYHNLHFSVSHAAGFVACLLSWHREVGVDVEPIHQVDGMLNIADQYFAPAEIAFLRTLPADEQSRGFLELWTLKESYLKARGSGLSVPLREIAFDIKKDADAAYRILATFGPELPDDSARWQFNLERLDGHLIAIAVERRSRLPVNIVMHDAVELMNWI